MTLFGAPRATFVYPKVRYGSTPLTLTIADFAMMMMPGGLALRGANLAGDGSAEYLYSRLEESCELDLFWQTDLAMTVRRFFEDHAGRGSQFELWADRHTGSVWHFEDSLADQNNLALVLNTGTASYAAASVGRGVSLGAAQALSVATAQESAGTKTGYDDPLNKDEGVICLDLKPTWAGNDGVLHSLLDTAGATNRLRLYKTAANDLVFEIVDAAGDARSKAGAVTWSANDRVQIVLRWTTGGVLTLWYAVAGGAFTELTTAVSAGTGLITTLGATLYVASDNAAANRAPGVWDSLAIFKRAFDGDVPTRVLAAYLPWWRNYYAYGELLDPTFKPPKLVPGKDIWRMVLRVRNGNAATVETTTVTPTTGWLGMDTPRVIRRPSPTVPVPLTVQPPL